MATYMHGDARGRRKMLSSMGLADPIPSVSVQRSWAFIDDRTPPEGDTDGDFATFTTWVNKASSWIGWTGAKCFDAKDRPCRQGGDMMRARDEEAFPVRWYWPDRFREAIVPSKRDLALIKGLTSEPRSIADIYEEAGVKRYSTDRFFAFFTADELTLKMIDGILHAELSPQGLERQQWWKSAAFRASCI